MWIYREDKIENFCVLSRVTLGDTKIKGRNLNLLQVEFSERGDGRVGGLIGKGSQ